ncbi:hypothetical protein ATJ88_0948 [Isoptericola jiangsuensis]|uniref:Aromatic ring-opening dioxygenase LigA n=1 Tax=Isoptericola jiangsuensis TaxID=548579 RepID=A0A2A9EUT8_9MICO|nr:hypothetical protein ATJ88_0948 [Isoptericola jiangsuensis]
MSSTVTVRPPKGARGIGLFSVIVGIVLIVAGAVVWVVVSQTLADEQITVSEDASFLAGDEVDGPFSAFAQAEVINKHALEASGGMTYAELDQEDPTRATVMNASFLRASLFTSVVAFGVCALVIGLGLMFILIGVALRRLAGGSEVSVESPTYASSGSMSQPAAAPVAPAAPAAAPAAAAAPPAAPGAPPRHSAVTGDESTTDAGTRPTAPGTTPPVEQTEPVDPNRREDGTDRT